MRGMFSLIGLLITVAIIAYVWSSYNQTVVKEGRHAQDMAQDVVGNAPDGTPAINTVTLEPLEKNGQLQSIAVKSVVPGGIMEKFYGLRADDQIVEIGPLALRDNDSGTAMALMQEAYMRKQSLTVLRNGQRLTLPSLEKPAGGDSAAQLQQGLQRIPTH